MLVLGAGASKPFGFPSGRELVDIVTGGLQDPGGTDLGKFLISCGFKSEDLRQFSHNLVYSQRNSVDAFLEYRPEFTAVGKAAIVSVLIQREDPKNLFIDGDWYRYLFQMLNTSFEDFEKNTIAIITFNYDRSLEFYLVRALKAAYGRSVDECVAKVASIPIIHLHGKMGEIFSVGEKFRDYAPTLNPEAMQLSSEQIKIVHEDIGSEPEFAKAHERIFRAETLCFLGFGYDRTNIKRLFPEKLFPNMRLLYELRIFGSAQGLTHAEVDNVKNIIGHFGKIDLDAVGYGCLEYLRENRVLF